MRFHRPAGALLLTGVLLCGAALGHSQGIKPGAEHTANTWNEFIPQSTSLRSAMDQLPSGWRFDLQMPLEMPGLVSPPKVNLWSSSIDSRCIVHRPQQARLSGLSSGEPLMQTRYPRLMKMPVQQAQERTEAKIEAIPRENR
jgi:hypothetical protein